MPAKFDLWFDLAKTPINNFIKILRLDGKTCAGKNLLLSLTWIQTFSCWNGVSKNVLLEWKQNDTKLLDTMQNIEKLDLMDYEADNVTIPDWMWLMEHSKQKSTIWQVLESKKLKMAFSMANITTIE